MIQLKSTHIHCIEEQSSRRALVAAGILLCLISSVGAFSFVSSGPQQHHASAFFTTASARSGNGRWKNPRSSRRHAIIYDPDGGTQDEYSSSASTPLYYEESVVSTMTTIMESLSSETAALARMAVAFAPKEHNLKIEDIEMVHVLNVDESYIELSAVLCENHDCLTVAVPVSFPKSCHGVNELEDCIVDNVGKLGEIAEIKIRDIELGCPKQKIFKTLIESENLENNMPFWWVKPTTGPNGLKGECESMRSLLNDDDFQAELIALAKTTIAERSDENYTVEQVGVAAVGPAGIFLRAYANGLILELPLGFPSGVAVTVDGLRGSVLEMVEQVEEEC